jgi:hypothetical protein
MIRPLIAAAAVAVVLGGCSQTPIPAGDVLPAVQVIKELKQGCAFRGHGVLAGVQSSLDWDIKCQPPGAPAAP